MFDCNDFWDCFCSYMFGSMKLYGLEILLRHDWQHKAEYLLQFLIPKIAELALSLPALVTKPVLLLLASTTDSVSLSQNQVASLLANAFFCTFSVNPFHGGTFNEINFQKLHFGTQRIKIEKLKCIFAYFEKVIQIPPIGNISITRTSAAAPKWNKLDAPIGELVVSPDGKIENEGKDMLQVDFANKYIGGGVLNCGCVQEEIRFLICPELLVSCLICQRMNDDEAILIKGAERYSDYSGYGNTFRFVDMQIPQEPSIRDELGRAEIELVAMDALSFSRSKTMQFGIDCINRELGKAYAAFTVPSSHAANGITTGNWGCGVFQGDLELKSMIQLMAASAAGRFLQYFTFGNRPFAEVLNRTVELLRERNITIAALYQLVCSYGYFHGQSRELSLFDYISLNLKVSETDK